MQIYKHITLPGRYIVAFSVGVFLSASTMAFLVAEAASELHSTDGEDITQTSGEYASGLMDASDYENLIFSFDYDSTALDGKADSFTYGWRSGGTDNDISTINGQANEPDSEVDSISASLPTDAQVTDLEVYVYVTAKPGDNNDVVKLTNIKVVGEKLVADASDGGEQTDSQNDELSDSNQNSEQDAELRVCNIIKDESGNVVDAGEQYSGSQIEITYPDGTNEMVTFDATATYDNTGAGDAVCQTLNVSQGSYSYEVQEPSNQAVKLILPAISYADPFYQEVRDQEVGNTSLTDLLAPYYNEPTLESSDRGDDIDIDPGTYTLVLISPPPEDQSPATSATVIGQKIVCQDESVLPNGSPDSIDANTAAKFVADNPGCKLASDWQFQWATEKISSNTVGSNVGELTTAPWTTSTPTDETGATTMTIPLDGQTNISVREIWQDDYIQFTGRKGGEVTAELYCTGDGQFFDNMEWLKDAQPDDKYYCVAWNVKKTADVNLCKLDAETQEPLSGWQLALLGEKNDTLSVVPDGTTQSFTGVPVGDYVLEAAGTYEYRGNSGLLADARFSERKPGDAGYSTSPYTPWREALSPNQGLAVQVNGDSTLWGSVYNPAHVYYGAITQTALGAVNTYVYDNQYRDNVGTIDLTLFTGRTGVTEQDGCVTFSNVPYGEYQVKEVLQDGWTNHSGLETVVVDEDIETFNVKNRQATEVPADPKLPPVTSCSYVSDIALNDIPSQGNVDDNVTSFALNGLDYTTGDEFDLFVTGDTSAAGSYQDEVVFERTVDGLRVFFYGNGNSTPVKEFGGSFKLNGVDLSSASITADVESNEASGAWPDEFFLNQTTGEVTFTLYTNTSNDSFIIEGLTENCSEDETDPQPDSYRIEGYKYEVLSPYGPTTDLEVASQPKASWEIKLYDDEQNLVSATNTDKNGYYYFEMSAGGYEVQEVMQANWEQVGVQDGNAYEVSSEGPQTCDVTLPVADKAALMFGVYEGGYPDGVTHSGGFHPQGEVDIYLPEFPASVPDRSVTLVLSAYEPVKWNITGPGKRIIADVVASGYYDQEVAGLSSDVIVATTSYESGDSDYYKAYSEDSAEYNEFINYLENEHGVKDILRFYGEYAKEEFDLTDEDFADLDVSVRNHANKYECDFYNTFLGDEGDDSVDGSNDGSGNGTNTGTTDEEGVDQVSTRSSGSTGTRVDRRSAPEPLVAGVATTAQNFCPFLEDHMQMGWENDEMEVMKLQLFLDIFKDMYGGVENPVTGDFGKTTDANVKAFQEHYREEVLDPWYSRGIVPHNRPTGFVYKTTKWKINSIVCPDYAEVPDYEGEDLSSNVALNSRVR